MSRARNAASPRGASRTRWTRSSTRPGTTCATRRPGAHDDGRRAQRLLDADGPVHRRHRARHPAPALRAVLDQGDARPGVGEDRRAVHAALHAGDAAQPHLLPAQREGRQGIFFAGHRHADDRCAGTHRRRAPGRRFQGRVRRRRQDGQDGAERRRAAGPDRQVRRGHRAALRDVRRFAGRFRDLVRYRRGRRAPLPEAAVDVRAGARATPSAARRAAPMRRTRMPP